MGKVDSSAQRCPHEDPLTLIYHLLHNLQISFSYQTTTNLQAKTLPCLETPEDLQAERILKCSGKAKEKNCLFSSWSERINAVPLRLSRHLRKVTGGEDVCICLMCKFLYKLFRSGTEREHRWVYCLAALGLQ